MLRLSLILFFFSSTVLGIAQTHYFHKQWDKRFGGTSTDGFQSFQQTIDGGFILGGFSTSDSSGNKTQPRWGTNNLLADYWIVKTDSGGNKQWDKRFGGGGSDDLGSIKQTKDGGYVLSGHSSSGMTGNKTQGSRGGFDFWVIKIDSVGNQQWDKRFGGTLDEYGGYIIETYDNGYILVGSSNSPISGDKTQDDWDATHFYDDVWIVKIDSLGNKQWDKRLGGIEQDGAYRIIRTVDGGYLLGGATNSRISGDIYQDNWDTLQQTFDYWIVKIDSFGIKTWDRRFGGTQDEAGTIILSTDEGYLLCGTSESNISGNKTENKLGYWIVSIDTLGNKNWDKSFADANSIRGFSKTNDRGYLISGISVSYAGGDKSENNLGATQIWIVKTDTAGNKQWDKTIFTTKYTEGYAIQTTDGCFAVGSFTKSGIGGYKSQANWDSTEATQDYWIMKFCMDTIRETGIDDRPQTTDHSRIQIQAWPNPFSSDLSITLKGEDIHEASFTITNAMGQVIYKREESNLAAGYTKVLDLSYLPNGVYFVEVGTKEGCSVRQVVKE